MTNPFEIIEARLSNIESLLIDLKFPQPADLKPENETLHVEGVALLTGYKQSYIYKLWRLRQIPGHKPNGGRLYFLRSEIMEWIKAGRRATHSEITQAVNQQLAGHE